VIEKKIIGRKDKADLPALHISDVEVKIDSGAYSCSIHCEEVYPIEQENQTFLEVIFLDREHPKYTGERIRFQSFKKKRVKSSTGHQQERYFVQLTIVLFDQSFTTDFSLTKRNGLRHPILLGRKLLNNQFMIDTSKTNISYKIKQKKRHIG
jgi:hypothetical protein